MYFEIWKNDNLIKRGDKTLEPLSFDNELMYVPEFTLVLPIEWLEYFDGWEEVKVYINNKCLYGLVWDLEPDKIEEKLTVTCRHIISEWEHRQISVNHAMSNKNLNIVFKGEKVEVNEQTGETITASAFSIIDTKVASLTNAYLIERASATAWVTSNGDKVQITSVDKSAVKKEEGTYNVTFATAKGTKVTVECEVKTSLKYDEAKTVTSKPNQEVIQAYPFTVNTDLGLTAEDVKQKVKAKAWKYKHKDQAVAVTSITTNFQNIEGDYNVTASTSLGTSVTVQVTVEGATIPVGTEASVIDKLEDIYNDTNFAYPGWQIEFQDDSATRMIDYVYSKQNKLEALTQTMELTDDLWWRVGWWNYKKVEIGKFGDIKPYIISKKPSGETNIRIIGEPVIDYDFETVINVATVYSDKSDSGMASLTLREVYNDKSLQKTNFPVIILRSNVNNERDYASYLAPNQPPKVAPNNELEFAVLDTVSIALESGRLIEGAFPFNDLNPFEIESNQITDAKRVQAAKTVYQSAIRKLIQNRRAMSIQVQVEEIPPDLLPGDKVRLLYDNNLWNIEACSSYWKKIIHEDDYYYITQINYEIDENEVEVNTITLAKWLKVERETQA